MCRCMLWLHLRRATRLGTAIHSTCVTGSWHDVAGVTCIRSSARAWREKRRHKMPLETPTRPASTIASAPKSAARVSTRLVAVAMVGCTTLLFAPVGVAIAKVGGSRSNGGCGGCTVGRMFGFGGAESEVIATPAARLRPASRMLRNRAVVLTAPKTVATPTAPVSVTMHHTVMAGALVARGSTRACRR